MHLVIAGINKRQHSFTQYTHINPILE